jgi:hypothetical protein
MSLVAAPGRNDIIDMPDSSRTRSRAPRSRRASTSPPPTDHTRWMAVVIELLAIAAAVIFAYEHART